MISLRLSNHKLTELMSSGWEIDPGLPNSKACVLLVTLSYLCGGVIIGIQNARLTLSEHSVPIWWCCFRRLPSLLELGPKAGGMRSEWGRPWGFVAHLTPSPFCFLFCQRRNPSCVLQLPGTPITRLSLSGQPVAPQTSGQYQVFLPRVASCWVIGHSNEKGN